MALMSDISYYRVETNGDNNMEEIKQKVNEELQVAGKVYHDEITKYLLTGEFVVKTDSQKRLILDIQYLLKKVSILEDMLENVIVEKQNIEHNRKSVQTTVQEAWGVSDK